VPESGEKMKRLFILGFMVFLPACAQIVKELTPAYLALSASSLTSQAGANPVTGEVLPPGMPLSAASDQSLLTITSIAGGTLRFSFTANTSTFSRTRHVTVPGPAVTVTQDGLTAQTIAFGPLSNQPFGSAPFPVGATASSGLALSFASHTPALSTASGNLGPLTRPVAGADTAHSVSFAAGDPIAIGVVVQASATPGKIRPAGTCQ
jgi:hypothetical protein